MTTQSVNEGFGHVLKLRTHDYARLEHYFSEAGSGYWLRTTFDIDKATVLHKEDWEPWLKHGVLVPVKVERKVTILPG